MMMVVMVVMAVMMVMVMVLMVVTYNHSGHYGCDTVCSVNGFGWLNPFRTSHTVWLTLQKGSSSSAAMQCSVRPADQRQPH